MSHFITLNEGATMTSSFRAQKESILDLKYQNLGILPLCETFDKSEIETILGQTGCEKLRIYYGMDENDKVHAIIVAVNDQDEDMLPGDPDEANEQIAERSTRCPTTCPPASVLNQD